MKKIILLIVLISVIILNPNEKKHSNALKNGIEQIIRTNPYFFNAESLSVGNGKSTVSEIIEKHIDYTNYYLLSTSSFENQIVAFGFFGNIFLIDEKLENNFKSLLIKFTNFFSLDFFTKSNKFLKDVVSYNEYKLKDINPISEESNKATIVNFEKNKFVNDESDITYGEPFLLTIKTDVGSEILVFLGDINQLKDGIEKDAFLDKLKPGNKFIYESYGEGNHGLYHEYFKKVLFY